MNLKHKLVKLITLRKGPQMIWGYKNPNGPYRKNTRISNSTFIDHPEKLSIGDHVFIGHYNYIEASYKVIVEEGCQITNFISITSHSSHIAIRLYGQHYIDHHNHIGYVTGPVRIGKYSFIGPHSIIMPNTSIGKGSIVSAFSYVKGTFPDFSIIQGNPAKIAGDTRELDAKYLSETPEIKKFYDQWAL